MSNEQLDRLKAEEAQLEAQMFGDPQGSPEVPAEPQADPSAATGEQGVVQTQEELEASEIIEEIIVQPTEPEGEPVDIAVQQDPAYQEPSESQPAKVQRTPWKKRFQGLQKTHEAVIRTHERTVTDLNARIARLEKELFDLRSKRQEVQGDVFDGVFSDEDEETFGSEGLDIVKRAAKTAIEKQVKPLQEQLRKQEEDRLTRNQVSTQAARQAEYQKFLDKLGELVPDYSELNTDKKFLQWMAQADEFSGQVRGELFRKAEANGDVLRVADFFMQFQDSQQPQEPAVPEEIERHITPAGTGAAPAAPQGQQQVQYIKESAINKFYSDVLKGRYEGRHDTVQATEAAIEQAWLEKRVLRGQ